jgi:hypothetical protein
MNCNKCLQKLIINNVEKNELRECRSCNLGVLSNNCECEYYNVLIQEYWCKNCNIQLEKCIMCNNYYDKLIKSKCNICIENLKNNNPSNEYNKYIFDDENLIWKIFEKKYVCNQCNISNYYNINHSIFKHYDYEYICISCKINNLKNIYNNYEFIFNKNKEKIFFKKKCICKKYTNYIDVYYINTENSKYILQCKNCNPSTNYEIYEFYTYINVWQLKKLGKKCNLCNSILWKYPHDSWGHIIQCIEHKPINNFIKFKFNNGYIIDKIKSYNGKKHVWKNAYINDLNYKCDCIKCNN